MTGSLFGRVVTPIQLLALVGALVLIGIAVVIVRRRFGRVLQEDSNEILAISAAILSVYGLILGLTLNAAWERFQLAQFSLRNETAAMVGLSRMSTIFDELGIELRDAVIAYGDAVVQTELNGEWNAADQSDDPGAVAFRDVYATMEQINEVYAPVNAGGIDPSWDVIYAMEGFRESRIELVRNGLPTAFWWVLILGAGLSITALVIILPTHPRLHLFIAVWASALILLTLILINNLDHPLSGAFTVDFDEYQDTVNALRREDDIMTQQESLPAGVGTPVPSS